MTTPAELAYRVGIRNHMRGAAEPSQRRLTVRREPAWMRLGSFVLAVALHRVTALFVCGAGAWALIYVGLMQAWPW